LQNNKIAKKMCKVKDSISFNKEDYQNSFDKWNKDHDNILIKWLQAEINIPETTSKKENIKEKKVEETIETFKIWDETEALRRMGSKKDLLLKILRSFRDNADKMMYSLEKAIVSENFSDAQLHTHSIKGSAGNVSAHKLADLARVMELAAKEEDIELTDTHFKILEYIRTKVKSGETLTIRAIGKSGIVDIKGFYTLFPGGPLKKATKIAGVSKPSSCV